MPKCNCHFLQALEPWQLKVAMGREIVKLVKIAPLQTKITTNGSLTFNISSNIKIRMVHHKKNYVLTFINYKRNSRANDLPRAIPLLQEKRIL